MTGITKAAPAEWTEAAWVAWVRLAPAVTVALLGVLVVRSVAFMAEALASPGALGIDYAAVTDGARRWVETGTPFLDRQLQGPYPQIGSNPTDTGEFLYPPVALPVFLAFAYLPAVLWWAIPAGLAVVGLARLRPARWAWPLLALLAAAGQSIPLVIAGNPTMWAVALALWAPRVGWMGALILLKPTVAPLALLGIRHRSWWVGVAVMAVASIPFLGLWPVWVKVLTDTQTSGSPGIAYSLVQGPALLFPVLAWASGERRLRA